MKRNIYLVSLLALAGCMASCSNENKEPEIETVETLSGFYTVNNGSMSSNIPSNITSYNPLTGTTKQGAFKAANGIALGMGGRPALIYGSKMYIPMTDSNIIWVVDPVTLKIISSIRPEGEANSPREAVGADGKVYVSMFSGYVCRIDTTTLTIDKTVKTGPNSEEMAIAGGKLYVANSDGYNYANNYQDCSISIIDLATMSEKKIKDTSKVLNPTDMATNGKDVFVICKGNYSDIPSTVKKIEGDDVKDVAPGNYMAINGDRLYVINNIYGVPRKDMGFDVFNTSSLKNEGSIANQTEGTDSWVDYPCCIDVDPVEGDIVIASYKVTDAGYAAYTEPCYVNVYDKSGNFKTRVECGIDVVGVTFVHKTIII